MLPAPVKFNEYCRLVANYLRGREANLLRGQREGLDQLDQLTDVDLLRKWSWTSAIIGGIVAFAVMPIVLMVLHSLIPVILMQFLWAFTKVTWGLACAMFALAAFFTFFMSADN